jgi:WD40 repeat protein
VFVYDTATGKLLFELNGHTGTVRHTVARWLTTSVQVVCPAFSNDGNLLVTGSMDQTARVWDMRDGRLFAVLKGHESMVLSCLLVAVAEVYAGRDGRVF